MKNKKGFTLIELILAMSLLVIIGVFVLGFMMPLIKSYTQQNTIRRAKDTATILVAYLKEEIHCATDVVKTGTEGPVVYRITGSSTLSRGGAAQIKANDVKVILEFVPVSNAMQIKVTIFDLSDKELYSLTTSASATDGFTTYQGVPSNSLSLTKRASCR